MLAIQRAGSVGTTRKDRIRKGVVVEEGTILTLRVDEQTVRGKSYWIVAG